MFRTIQHSERPTFYEMFSKYKDPNSDVIQQDGVEALYRDLELNRMEGVILMYAFRQPGSHSSTSPDSENADFKISTEGFCTGMKNLNCHDLETLKASLHQFEVRAKFDDNFFKKLYTFHFSIAATRSRVYVDLEVAIHCWKTTLEDRFPLLDLWCDYLKQNNKVLIPKDTCQMLLTFALDIKADLSNYNEEDAWPTILDEFVTHAKSLMGGQPGLKEQVTRQEQQYLEAKETYIRYIAGDSNEVNTSLEIYANQTNGASNQQILGKRKQAPSSKKDENESVDAEEVPVKRGRRGRKGQKK